MRKVLLGLCLAFGLFLGQSPVLQAHDDGGLKDISAAAGAGTSGNGPWNFENMTLKSHMPLDQIGNGGFSNVLGNDIWGWTHQPSGREFAIFGLTNGTSFIEVTDPTNPVYLGKLDSHTGSNSTWRDMKVFNNKAYIVADNNGFHGMQTFDLTQLLTVNSPQSFTGGNMGGFSRAHNIAINEDSGYAYITGHRNYNNEGSGLSSGLIAVDLNGANPTIVGDFGADGYTHDAQVVNYTGPDTDYAGQEIAFAANEDTFTIVNVTDKSNMTQISRNPYADSDYSHQGWLSEDQRYYFLNDELDEYWHVRGPDGQLNTADDNPPMPTRTYVWNVEDLDNPQYLGFHEGTEATIDHNLYVKDGLIYEANYTSGLRILKIVDAENALFEEVAFFDTYSPDNNVSFNGAWSVFPYFDSGSIIVSDRQGGLFVLELNSIPEPSTYLLSSIGMLLMGVVIWRRRRRV